MLFSILAIATSTTLSWLEVHNYKNYNGYYKNCNGFYKQNCIFLYFKNLLLKTNFYQYKG